MITPVIARWRNSSRLAKRTAIGLGVLGLLASVSAYGTAWRASRIVNRLLRDWAAGTIAQQSGGVYQLDLSRVRFDWERRRIAVDSISLTTRLAINARRPQPLPGLRLALHGCTLGGVEFLTLVRRAGLIAGSLGCRSGSLVVDVPRPDSTRQPEAPRPARATRTFGERGAFLVFQQGVRPPSYAPRVRIARVLFPRMALEVRLPRTAGGATRLELGRLQWSMAGLAIDPTDTAAASRPLFSREIVLVASNFITHPSRATEVRVGRLRASLTDSTVEVRGVRFAPTAIGADQWRRQRRNLVTLTAGHITVDGIDFGAFVLGLGIRARHIAVDSFRVVVANDRRVPRGPPGPPHRMPQQWLADLDETLSLDSLRLRNGDVVYRQHAAGREHPGVLTFDRIEAVATNVHHFVGPRTSDDPMTLMASARVQGAGQLEVLAVVPLDAPRFDMTLRGTLGALSAPVLNTFVAETGGVRIENGQVVGVDFRLTVRNGVAAGTVTPLYHDLAVAVTRTGSGGVLGAGGILGGVSRFVANSASGLMLRGDNPGHPSDPPRSGSIGRTFTDETLIAFLWWSVRDGLLSVLRK